MSTIPTKPVYLGDLYIGTAATWCQVAAMLRDRGIQIEDAKAGHYGFETPTGFFVNASVAQRRQA